ncbi:MAG: hypothetical protein ACT4PL_03625 [Phycisphaerales bacterium]
MLVPRITLGVVVFAGLAAAVPSSARPASSGPGHEPARMAAGARVDTDELIRLIRHALTTGDPAAKEQLVRGIRALRDPSFAPLLAHLADASGASDIPAGVRTQALLALAECDQGAIDLLLVRKLTPPEQAAVLAEALAAALLRPEQTVELARWPDLQPGVLYSLQARLAAAGRPIDEARLLSMAETQPAPLAGAALLILAQGSADATERDSALARAIRMIAPGSGPLAGGEQGTVQKAALGRDALRALVTMSGQWGLSRTGDFGAEVLKAYGQDREVRLDVASALLQVEPGSARALSVWLDAQLDAAEQKDQGAALRLAGMAQRALLGLAMNDTTAPGLRNVLVMAERLSAQKDELARRIGTALRALANGSDDSASAVEALVRTRHAPSMSWCMDAAEAGRGPGPLRVYGLVLEVTATEPDAMSAQVATDAAGRLCAASPVVAGEALAAALRAPDGATSQRLLMGALQGGARSDGAAPVFAEAIEAAHSVSAADRARGALLLARAARPPKDVAGETWLTDAAEDRLARIAQGEGDLSAPLRMQAAWLVIRHRQKERLALAQIIAEVTP